MNLNAPLSPDEIDELSEFLLSDAMPDEGMDIVALDGFLTAMIIGPAPLPPDAWMPVICGGEQPGFDSEEQVRWFVGQIMRLANTISLRLAADPPCFEPILQAEEVEGETHWIADSWCYGFMQVVESGVADWLPFFENPSNVDLLAPMLTLGTPEGDKALDAAPDAAAKIDLCVETDGTLRFANQRILAQTRTRWKWRSPTRRQDRTQRPLSMRQRPQVQKVLRRLRMFDGTRAFPQQ